MKRELSIGDKKYEIEMMGELPKFFEKFCNDLEYEIGARYSILINSLRSDLYLYNENERLGIVKIKIKEIRKELKDYSEKIYFSVDDIKIVGMLPRYIIKYFNDQLISQTTEIRYSEYINPGEYDFNFDTKVLTVYPEMVYLNNQMDFYFSLLNEFQPFINYATNALFFNKLKELEWKLKAFMETRDRRILTRTVIGNHKTDKSDELEESKYKVELDDDISLDYILTNLDEMKYFRKLIPSMDDGVETKKSKPSRNDIKIRLVKSCSSDKIIDSSIDEPQKKQSTQIDNRNTPILYVDDNGDSEQEYFGGNYKIKKEFRPSKQGNKVLSSETDIKDHQELPHTQIEQQSLFLADVFESKTRYTHIMNILVSTKKCHSESHIWIGTQKGDYSFLAAILKYLHSQGYYKDKRLSHKEIKKICMSTFKMEVSIDTIKKANPENFDLRLIPLASTLSQ